MQARCSRSRTGWPSVERLIAEPVAAVRRADPVNAPQALGVRTEDRRLALLLEVPPGTYKLRLPGERPFGLLSVDPR